MNQYKYHEAPPSGSGTTQERCITKYQDLGKVHFDKINGISKKDAHAHLEKQIQVNQFGTECTDIRQINTKSELELNKNMFGAAPKIELNKGIVISGFCPLISTINDTLVLEGYFMFSQDTVKHRIYLKLSSFDQGYIKYRDVITPIYNCQIKPEFVKALIILPDDIKNGYPEELNTFKNLTSLRMAVRKDRPLPDFIFQQNHLRNLSLECLECKIYSQPGDTIIFKVPRKLWSISTLKSLSVESAKIDFGGDFPANSNLENLVLKATTYTTPVSIVNLSKLKSIDFYFTRGGQFPDNLNVLKELEYINLFLPKDISLPKNFGPWPKLKKLTILGGNKLTLADYELLVKQQPNTQLSMRIPKY